MGWHSQLKPKRSEVLEDDGRSCHERREAVLARREAEEKILSQVALGMGRGETGFEGTDLHKLKQELGFAC